MSSYSSSHSGYLHPSQYPPNPPQQQPPQPPYPTTPGAPPTSQPQPFYPPAPQHQQPMYSSPQQQFYSTSPTSQYQTPLYSTSPTTQVAIPQPTMERHRRSSSLSQSQHPQFPTQSTPIPIVMSQHPVTYARDRNGSHGSQQSAHMHDRHAYTDGEDKYAEEQYGGLDEETLRSYERRYAKDRKLEKRPTLGGSLMSMARALGRKRE